MRKIGITIATVLSFSSLLYFGNLSGPVNAKTLDSSTEFFEDQAMNVIEGLPIIVVDKNREGVFVGISGITAPIPDEVFDMVNEINSMGGLKASENVIDYKDQDGNVLMKIPEELNSKLETKIIKIVEKHNEAVQKKYKSKRKGNSILKDNEKWPLNEKNRDVFK